MHEQPPNGERRVTPVSTFFDALDAAHLGLERSADGQPSITDFYAFLLPRIIERFENDFDDLQPDPDIPTVRYLIGNNPIFGSYYVTGVLTDDRVELVYIEFDPMHV